MAVLKTVSELKDSASALLSGLNLNSIQDLNATLERAARTLVQKADIPEASGTQNIVLYDNVFDYPCDDVIFGTSVNDIRPQGVSRNPGNFVFKRFDDDFDRNKEWLPGGTMFTFQYFNGDPIIRIVAKQVVPSMILSQMNSTTGVTSGGTLSGLTIDYAVYYKQPASLRFNLTSGTATLDLALATQLDLSSYQGVGVGFLAIEIPTGNTITNLTSIALRIGSDSSNYSSITQTQGFLGAFILNDWLLVAFDQASAINTGTPNWAAIDYVQIRINTTGSFTNFRVGGLFLSQPNNYQILYNTAAIFLPVGSQTPLTTITSDTDTIILNNPAYTLYQYESAMAILENTGAGDGDPVYDRMLRKLNGDGTDKNIGLYPMFRGDNPSSELRLGGTWYSNARPYNNGLGNNY